MKINKILLLSGLAAIIFGCSQKQITNDYVDPAIMNDINMGLSQLSVFDIPTPPVAKFGTTEPGELDRLPLAYSTLPPQIGHAIEEYMPITMEDNECIDCHDRRKHLKREWRVGKKLPMPDNHYGSFTSQGGVEDVAGARYNCTQCHVVLSDAPPLVENLFFK
ncbi:MAG: hypothetical protein GY744_01640 [Gammaproteobacteria bacterium]|nr:hypothetical protein [Gammaproteobacteria bacterium]